MKNQQNNVKNQKNPVAERLRQLSRIYNVMVEERNKQDRRLALKTRFLNDKEWEGKFTSWGKDKRKKEEEIKDELVLLVKQHPWGEYLLKVRGVGAGIAGAIIGELCGDIYGALPKGASKEDLPPFLAHGPRPFERTSDLWAYAGFAVKDGKVIERKKGEVYSHNKYLKLACYKFAVNQIKQGDKYRKIYDIRKELEKKLHPDKIWEGKYWGKTKKKKYLYTPKHIDIRARRYMIKKFLSDIKHDLVDQKWLATSV